MLGWQRAPAVGRHTLRSSGSVTTVRSSISPLNSKAGNLATEFASRPMAVADWMVSLGRALHLREATDLSAFPDSGTGWQRMQKTAVAHAHQHMGLPKDGVSAPHHVFFRHRETDLITVNAPVPHIHSTIVDGRHSNQNTGPPPRCCAQLLLSGGQPAR